MCFRSLLYILIYATVGCLPSLVAPMIDAWISDLSGGFFMIVSSSYNKQQCKRWSPYLSRLDTNKKIKNQRQQQTEEKKQQEQYKIKYQVIHHQVIHHQVIHPSVPVHYQQLNSTINKTKELPLPTTNEDR